MTHTVEKIRINVRTKLESIYHFWKNLVKKYPLIIQIYTVFSWISLIAFALSLVFVKDSRIIFVQYLWSFYVILQFWLLCRSKTLSWKKYIYFFVVGGWLIAPLNNIIVQFITFLFGGTTTNAWSMALLTPVAEEVLKLIPLGVYLFLSRRATSLSLSDYAIIGAASGAGFQFFEEAARRLISGNHYGVTLLQGKVLHWDLFTLFPGYFESIYSHKMTSGHALLTALIALGIGFAIRYKKRFKRYSYSLPIFLLVWAIFDHAIWNAGYSAPKWLTNIHGLFGSGYAAKPVFLIMLVVALFIDYWELNRVRGEIPTLSGESIINPISELWNLILFSFKDRVRFGYLLLFYRERRELGFALIHGNNDAKSTLANLKGNIQKYYKALTVIVLVLFSAILLAGLVVNTPDSSEACFACLFDRLQNWWDHLSGMEKAFIVMGAFALFFPLLGFWSSIAVVSTGISVAMEGHRTADIIRNPKKLLTPENAIAIGIGVLLSRIPFGKLGSSKVKALIKKIRHRFKRKKNNTNVKQKDDQSNQKSPQQNNDKPKVNPGEFTQVYDIDDFRSRVPDHATKLPWKDVPGGAAEGEKYRWIDSDGNTWNVRAHGPDPSAPSGSNAAEGWIYRVEVKAPSGKWTMDSSGNFHKKNVFNKNSQHYSEEIANDSHIPFLNRKK